MKSTVRVNIIGLCTLVQIAVLIVIFLQQTIIFVLNVTQANGNTTKTQKVIHLEK